MITCNQKPVVELRLTLPREGVWVAELEVESDSAITGAVSIVDGSASYAGTVVRSGEKVGSCYLEVVGGAGGLSQDVEARSYVGSQAKVIAVDTLALVGETLDASSTSSVLAISLQYWTRAGGRAGAAISTLAASLGAMWRVLPNGNVWIGTETFPAMPKSFESVELDEDPRAASVELAPDTIALRPGVTLDSRRVGRVEHRVGRDTPLRTTFWIAA